MGSTHPDQACHDRLVASTRLFVVQHADKQRLPGDPGLTDAGARQALAAAKAFAGSGVRRLVSSPLLRAQLTARPIGRALGLEYSLDDRLIERMNWDGTVELPVFFQEWNRANRDRSFTPTVGESSEVAGLRFAAIVEEVLAQDGDVAFVSHGGVTIDGLRTLFGDEVVARALPTWTEGVPSAGVTLIERTGQRIALNYVGDTKHLGDLDDG